MLPGFSTFLDDWRIESEQVEGYHNGYLSERIQKEVRVASKIIFIDE